MYGRPGPSTVKYAQLLEERFDIEVSLTCIVMEHPDYISEYDRMMKEEIVSRFGDDVFEKVWAEARE